MVKVLNNSACLHHSIKNSNEKAIFAKTICESYDDAIALIKARNLGPGEIAVVRYYINDAEDWNEPSGLPIRMIMGIGGANAQSDDDVFIFNDDRITSGSDPVSRDDVEYIISKALSNYYTKAELDKMLNPIINFDTIVTNRLNNMDNDIDELQGRVDKLSEDIDESKFATKDEVIELSEDVKVLEDNILLKADLSDIEDLEIELDSKADKSEINQMVSDAIANSDNVIVAINDAILAADIPGQVSDAVEGLDLVSNEKFDASLSEKANVNEVYTKDEVYTKEEITKIINNIDIPEVDLSNYYTKDEVYTKFEVDELIPDVTNFVTNETLTNEIETAITNNETIKELQTKVETLENLDGGEIEDEWVV